MTAGVLAAALVSAAAALVRGVTGATRARTARRRLPAREPAAVRQPLPAPEWLAARLAAAGVTDRHHAVWHAWLGAAVVAVGGGLAAGGPGLGLVAATAVVAGPLAGLAAFGGRGDRLLEAGLPDVLDAVARSLRAGASLPQALEEARLSVAGTLADDLATVAAAAAGGEPLESALDDWARRRPLPGVRLAVAALGLAATTGGAPARAVDGVAATLRSRLAVAGEVRALSSQARASALVIAAAPAAFMLLAVSGDPRTAAFLFRSPLGLLCLAGGLVLDAAGALWMHRLAAVEAW